MDITTPCCELAAEAETISGFGFSYHHTIANVDHNRWGHIVPEANLLMQPDYLQLVEEMQTGKMQFRYVTVQREGNTVGVMYFQVVRFEAAQLMNYFPKGEGVALRAGKAVSEKILEAISLKLLVTGNVFMTGESGMYFTHDIDKATRGKLLRRAISLLLKEDTTIKAALVSDLYAPKTAFDEGFLRTGYSEITVESDMGLQLRDEWHSIEDYLSAMSSKYRVRAKKVFSLCAENGVTHKELNADEIAAHSADIYSLYKKVMGNADFKLAELTQDYFYKQKLQLPNDYKLFAYYRQGQMIGFISAFHIGRRVEVHYTGMNHEVTKPIHLYQHMMYDMVAYGIQHRAEKLHFGRTAPEIKSTIGATPAPMYGYLKHRSGVFNTLFTKPYTRNLKPKQYELRSPFKG